MIVKRIKKQWVLLFFILIHQMMHTQYHNSIIISYQLAQLKKENAFMDIDNKLFQDLLIIADNCYQKILKILALYFSGVLIQSDRMYQEIIFEITNHILEAGQVVAIYLSKLLKNPHISIKQKIKRCSYIFSFLSIIILWMHNIYNPTKIKESAIHPNL